jgi:hypothetical protein
VADGEYRTRSGRVLTDADVQALADEAERGYDVEPLRGQRFARGVGQRLSEGAYQVVVASDLDDMLQPWLAANGWELFPIPADSGDLPTYGIRARR